MKNYSPKQSIIIVVIGCVLLLLCLYIFSPLFGTKVLDKDHVTQLEEAELGSAIGLYATVFQHYPTGENADLTGALSGDNPQHQIFLNLAENSTNKDGQMIDLWGTPYRISFNSTNSFTVTSAGSDHTFGNADDIVFDSNSNTVAKP